MVASGRRSRYLRSRPAFGAEGTLTTIEPSVLLHKLHAVSLHSALALHFAIDDGLARAYLEFSRQCRMALLWPATMASRARIPSAPPGHGSERTFTTPQPVAGSIGPRVAGGTSRLLVACRSQDHAHPRSRVHRRRDHALVWLNARRRSAHSATVAARSTAPADDAGATPHPRSIDTARRPPHRRARARHPANTHPRARGDRDGRARM